ncbi:MAG: porin [Duodenibacillus sp.]|nr:porin [Duodenibacillus sp.]
MQKTLAALAVCGAFAGSAMAADVTLYGILDTGVGYSHVDFDGQKEKTDNFSMMAGQASGSRWGLKGTEDLGNGLTVGFILESGFESDTGANSSSTAFFNRESSLYLQGGFGKIGFGRMGAFNNGQSSWAKIGMISAFGTSSWGGYSAQLSNLMSTAGQWNNMIAYETPDFAGFKVFAQYGMGSNDHENESSSDRFYAIGASYNNGPIAAYLAVDSINYQTVGSKMPAGVDIDDSLTVTLGGSYDFEVAKVYLGAQYFDEVTLNSIGGITKTLADGKKINDVSAGNFFKIKGYGISLSADAPVAGGKAMLGLGYVDAKLADSQKKDADGFDIDLTRYTASIGYDYLFSKRTDVYAVASYMQDKLEVARKDHADLSAYTLYVGLRHRF